jgi:SPP1 family predicted phage head-tail adaptor|nr:MAG TPA: Putative head tail adaptor [Caudoviricetes sp.]
MTGRIAIIRETSEVVDGRYKTKQEEYFKCWCDVSDLLSTEKYAALQQSLEETAVFKVRRCEKTQAMRMHLKEFSVNYKGDIFKIYSMTPVENGTHFLLKGNRVS